MVYEDLYARTSRYADRNENLTEENANLEARFLKAQQEEIRAKNAEDFALKQYRETQKEVT